MPTEDRLASSPEVLGGGKLPLEAGNEEWADSGPRLENLVLSESGFSKEFPARFLVACSFGGLGAPVCSGLAAGLLVISPLVLAIFDWVLPRVGRRWGWRSSTQFLTLGRSLP